MKTYKYASLIERSFQMVLAELKATEKIDLDEQTVNELSDRDDLKPKEKKELKQKIEDIKETRLKIEALRVAAKDGAAMYEAASKAKNAGITDDELALITSIKTKKEE